MQPALSVHTFLCVAFIMSALRHAPILFCLVVAESDADKHAPWLAEIADHLLIRLVGKVLDTAIDLDAVVQLVGCAKPHECVRVLRTGDERAEVGVVLFAIVGDAKIDLRWPSADAPRRVNRSLVLRAPDLDACRFGGVQARVGASDVHVGIS